MNRLLIGIIFAATAIAQNIPVITGPNPSVQIGANLYNIGTMRAYTGTGAPGAIAASVKGDFYLDTAGNVAYQCFSSTSCSSVAAGNWQREGYPTVVSVTSFGVSGSADTDAANFQTALNAAAGHFVLYIPGNFAISMGANSVSFPSHITLTGDGPTQSKITGVGLATPSVGVLDITANASDVHLSNIGIDGGITTPTGINYTAARAATAIGSLLSNGSSIYVHSGSSNITFDNIEIDHTAGYSILFDAEFGGISHVKITNSRIQNGRPHLFGTSSLVYGSWTSGILFFQDGTNTANGFTDVTVDNNTFQNLTGNAVWFSRTAGTALGVSKGVRITNNTFIDIGLDAVQVNGIEGYVETGNVVKRFGYVVTSDVGASRVGGPMWLQGATPVAFDTFFPVGAFVRSNNYAEGNGEMFDLDGVYRGVVSGNTFDTCFLTNDTLANPSQCGPSSAVGVNWTRGLSTNNSTGIAAVLDVSITGNNFNGVGNGGLILFGCQRCLAANNTILQTANNANPVVLGNLTASLHATNNSVLNNQIFWTPSTGSPAIFEDGATACACPFIATDNNIVRNNVLLPTTGNLMFEFQRDVHDASGTGPLSLSSVTPGSLVPINRYLIQTEGTTTPVLNFYQDVGAGTRTATIADSGFIPPVYLFANLPIISTRGQVIYCSDCTPASAPCTGGGSGHLAVTNATRWNCN